MTSAIPVQRSTSPQCKYMNFIYLKSSFITWMVYLDPTHCSAPSWLFSSVGRAHRHRRGHGFKSRTGMNFFQVLFLTTTSAVFLAARISQLRFFTAVQIYEFHISNVVSFSSIFYIFAVVCTIAYFAHSVCSLIW